MVIRKVEEDGEVDDDDDGDDDCEDIDDASGDGLNVKVCVGGAS